MYHAVLVIYAVGMYIYVFFVKEVNIYENISLGRACLHFY